MLRIVPARAFFRPGEPITLHATMDQAVDGELQVSVYHLAEKVAQWTAPVRQGRAVVEGRVPDQARRGYLVHAQVGTENAYSAFDVLERWTDAPRYGFLYDFSAARSAESIRETLDRLLDLHVNGLQFYDWQYRHDTLLPPQDEFVDPLGRTLSLKTVRALIESAHQRSMAAMPYTAIYAASPPFAEAHHDWQLFDDKGQPFDFANGFLKIMNPLSPWQAHFTQECRRVLDALPFDGIHVDQYGEPTTGCNASGEAVDLPGGFAATLRSLRAAIGPDKTLAFNLVHNWPADALSHSPLDFWYSELWPPDTDMARLWRTIRDNRRLNPRPAVLAVYIPPEHETTVIAAHSRILAAGGSHIAFGDHGRYLSDPYFPKAGIPSAALAAQLKQAADFSVAYEEALVFAQDVTDEWSSRFTLDAEKVDVIVRAQENRLFIHLLRADGRWDAAIGPREPLTNVELRLPPLPQVPAAAWCATPEFPMPKPLPFDGEQRLRLPAMAEWLMLCLEFKSAVGQPG